MNNSSSTHYFKVNFNQAVECLRKSLLDSLRCDHKPNLTTLDDIQAFVYDMDANATLLMKLVEIHADVRFNNFREACRDGWTSVLMPETTHTIELLEKDAEVFILVFSEDGSLMGTLVRKDLYY